LCVICIVWLVRRSVVRKGGAVLELGAWRGEERQSRRLLATGLATV
jgi:hypothetical protein